MMIHRRLGKGCGSRLTPCNGALVRSVPIPFATRAKLAEDINAILDRDHNRRTKVFVTLDDLSRARNLSVADVRAARQRRVTDAAGTLYQEIEAYQGYGPVEEPWPEIARLLATAGAILPRDYPAPRGQPRKDWHRPGADIARSIKTALRTAGASARGLAATNAGSATAEISARIVNRAYGLAIGAEQFAVAMQGLKRDRSTPIWKRQLSRIRVLD